MKHSVCPVDINFEPFVTIVVALYFVSEPNHFPNSLTTPKFIKIVRMVYENYLKERQMDIEMNTARLRAQTPTDPRFH